MLKVISNGSKWAGEAFDSIEELCAVLQQYPLDPTFEEYGNFVNRNPHWIKRNGEPNNDNNPYLGCTKIWGNFCHYSHVFDIITDEAEVINCLEKLIRANQATSEYQAAKKVLSDAKVVTVKAEQSSSGCWLGSIIFADGYKATICMSEKTKKIAEQEARKSIPSGYKERKKVKCADTATEKPRMIVNHGRYGMGRM